MLLSVLCSGSKGNCCVLNTKNVQIVIDCGKTQRYLKEKFIEINKDYLQTDALLITHHHTDHIAQIKMFDTIDTYSADILDTNNFHLIKPGDIININDVQIEVLALSHDIGTTVGYKLTWDNRSLVYITDTGYVSSKLIDKIKGCDYYILESNHDIEMLNNTKRPYNIKQRIFSDCGHLCNDDSMELVRNVATSNTKEIILAHVSEDGNCYELVETKHKDNISKLSDDINPNINVARQTNVLSIKLGN